MALCIVQNEAGRSNRGLADQISEIADQVIPALHKITGLALGQQPVIRLLPLSGWRDALTARQRASLREKIDAGTPLGQLMPARRELRNTLRQLRLVGRLVMGTTSINANGAPEMLLTPEGLKNAGFEEPELMKVTAHELNHCAQALAGATAFTAPDEDAAPLLFSGHSRWADWEVTKLLIGREVDEDTGRQTAAYWRTTKKMMYRYAKHPELMPGASRLKYQLGGQWVRQVVERVGTDPINRVWGDLSLAPTMAEITDVNAWIERVQRS
jgi:hypothetical protein